MLEWIKLRYSELLDYLNNHEELIMKNGTRLLAGICILIAIAYAVLFTFQVRNM